MFALPPSAIVVTTRSTLTVAIVLVLLLLRPDAVRVHAAATGSQAPWQWNSTYFQGLSASIQFPPSRNQYTITSLPGVGIADPGRILVMGGINSQAQYLNDVWASKDEGSTWTQVSDSFPPRTGAAACLVGANSILVIGGMSSATVHAQDSYFSADGGQSWTAAGINQPFQTDAQTQCIMHALGEFVFLWAGNNHFGSNSNQLWRAKYGPGRLSEWTAISTPAADGRTLLDRSNYAIQFSQRMNQLYVAGGYTSGTSSILQETLYLSMPTNSPNSSWSRSTIVSDLPSSSSQQPARLMFDRDQLPLYLYTPTDASLGLTMWIFHDYPASWVPIEPGTICNSSWSLGWSESTSEFVSVKTYETSRFLLLDQQLTNSTLMLIIGDPDADSSGVMASEGFASISTCSNQDTSSDRKWIIYVSIAGGVLVVGACIFFFLRRRTTRDGVGVNTPLIDKA